MIGFSSPGVLLVLGLVPVVLALWARDERRRVARLATLVDAGLAGALAIGVSARRRALRQVLSIAALVGLILAAAGPQGPGETELLPQRGLDVLFVVDASRSMRARDVLPDRLERVKAEISAFLPRLGDHRVGLVAFAGTAFVQCPLTSDVEAVRLFLSGLAPEALPQAGTQLKAGLEVALEAFRAEAAGEGPGLAKAGRVAVVLTDGEDHEGGFEDVAEDLREEGIDVVLIGIGSTLGEPIPIPSNDGTAHGYLKDRTGRTVMTRMSPELLREVADAVGGVFVDGTGQPDVGLREAEARIAGLEKREVEGRVRRRTVDRTWLPLVAAVLCACAALALSTRASTERRNT